MGNEIIFTDANGKEKGKPQLDRELNTEGGFMGTPSIYSNGHIGFANYTGKIVVLSEDGLLLNNYEMGNEIRHQPTADNARIFFTTENGRLMN